jgi:hypothetical protein
MPYTSHNPNPGPPIEKLRARIPGWGVDLDKADRPSSPQERLDLPPTGAHWDLPERQADDPRRERSIEHGMLTPVYGTAQPLHGVSGAIRRYAYAHYSEGRAAHWLLLIAGDRVEAIGAHARSLLTLRPDNPITETGILGEPRYRPLTSRFGRGRIDTHHTWMDPIIVAGPWVLAGIGAWTVAKRLIRR